MIKIKTTTPSQRCEICHQIDCFDPISETCTRCNKLPQVKRESAIEAKEVDQTETSFNYLLKTFWRTSFLFKLSLFYPLVIVSGWFIFRETGIDDDYRLGVYKTLPFWPIVILVIFSLAAINPAIQTSKIDAVIDAVKVYKRVCFAQAAVEVLLSLWRFTHPYPTMDSLTHPYTTPFMWIAGMFLPLLYMLIVLFIRDKEFPIAIRIIKNPVR